jgi:hypothetical protein
MLGKRQRTSQFTNKSVGGREDNQYVQKGSDATLGSLTVAGDVDIDGDLTVSGAHAISGDLDMKGNDILNVGTVNTETAVLSYPGTESNTVLEVNNTLSKNFKVFGNCQAVADFGSSKKIGLYDTGNPALILNSGSGGNYSELRIENFKDPNPDQRGARFEFVGNSVGFLLIPGTTDKSMIPCLDATINFGKATKRWKNACFSGSVDSADLKLSGSTSGVITIQPQAAAGTYALTLPNTQGSGNLQNDGAGNLSWATSGDVVGPASSVLNQIPLFADATGKLLKTSSAKIVSNYLEDLDGWNRGGNLTIDMSGISIEFVNTTTKLSIQPTVTQHSQNVSLLGNNLESVGTAFCSTLDTDIVQLNGATNGTLTLQVPASFSPDYALTFPGVQGASGQILSNNGAGVLSWETRGDFKADGSVAMTGDLDLGGNDLKNVNLINDIPRGTNLSGGVLEGGVLSIGTPNTTFSISDGRGVLIAGDPLGTGAMTQTNVTWSGKSNVAVTNIATQLITYVCINAAGNVEQKSARPSNADRRNACIFLGVVVHVNNLNVDAVNNEQDYSAHPLSQLRDLSAAIGFINISGNELSAALPNDLSIIKSVGTMYAIGSNYNNSPDDPNTITLPALNTDTGDVFQYRLSNGTNVVTQALVDPELYDNGSTTAAVPTNKWTIQRFYSFTSNNLKAQYGQTIYNSKGEALDRIFTDPFVTETSIAGNGLFISYLVVQQGSINLQDAVFVKVGKFGSAGIGSGGDVFGPSSATDFAVARFDTTSGKLLKSSTVALSDTGAFTGVTEVSNGGADILVESGTKISLKANSKVGLVVDSAGTSLDENDLDCKGKELQNVAKIQLGSSSGTSTTRCVSTRFVADVTNSLPGLVVKIVDAGVNGARVSPVLPTDVDSTGVIGVTMGAMTIGQDVDVCVGGVFEGTVQNGDTIEIGDMLEKSDVAGQDGRLVGNAAGVASPGTFAVAISGGTGDSQGTVKVRGIFIKNELL